MFRITCYKETVKQLTATEATEARIAGSVHPRRFASCAAPLGATLVFALTWHAENLALSLVRWLAA